MNEIQKRVLAEALNRQEATLLRGIDAWENRQDSEDKRATIMRLNGDLVAVSELRTKLL